MYSDYMRKAIFVMDQMPECCEDCELMTHTYTSSGGIEFWCVLLGHVEEPGIFKFGNCPLKEMPDKLADNNDYQENAVTIRDNIMFAKGWNACIEAIEGTEG